MPLPQAQTRVRKKRTLSRQTNSIAQYIKRRKEPMPNRRIYTSAIASIVAVICVITIQCSYASYAAAAEPQHTYTVSDDVQVEKTHAPSLSEAPFIYGPQTRSFNSVASPSITKILLGFLRLALNGSSITTLQPHQSVFVISTMVHGAHGSH